MDELNSGERQVAPTVAGIRRDHVARYEWAATKIEPQSCVLDLACGVGYGASILAKAGHAVLACDKSAEAITYGRQHYWHPSVRFHVADGERFALPVPWNPAKTIHAAVCFETIEHLADPLPMLKTLRCAPLLIASVPNEDEFPYQGYTFHHRHYRKAEFEALLSAAGWGVTEWYGQEGPESEVTPGAKGRTLIAVARRREAQKLFAVDEIASLETRRFSVDEIAAGFGLAPQPKSPEHVVIIGLGPSCEQYVDLVKRLGGRHKLADEVWAINALGDVLQCDLVFHMDDVRIQEIRANARPDSNIAAMLDWLRTTKTPVMTSRAHPDYPSLMEFPLERAINELGIAYFNNTAVYAVCWALLLGVKKISLFGCDYTYPNAHDAEKGRGCLEYWLGRARERGVDIVIAEKSALMDMIEDVRFRAKERDENAISPYGYDCVRVAMVQDEPGGPAKLVLRDRDVLPTADEIERSYDHARHPSPLAK